MTYFFYRISSFVYLETFYLYFYHVGKSSGSVGVYNVYGTISGFYRSC